MKKMHSPRESIVSLVHAHRIVAPFYTIAFTQAPVEVTRVDEHEFSQTYYFKIEGFGHGQVETNGKYAAFDQLTLGDEVRYTRWYAVKHGNAEIMMLLKPMLLGKLRKFIDALASAE